jgi:hypothetical protein
MNVDTNKSPERKKRPGPGRPQAIIDWDKVEQLIISGLNATQVAATLGIDRDTFYTRCIKDNNVEFSAFFQQKKATGEGLILQAQFHKALKEKNTTMLIWLGKQRCGQKDHDEIEQGTKDDQIRHKAIMDQLKALQEAQSPDLKKADTSNSTDNMS